MSWDAVVVGLGAMGSATLWRLAERGARVAGVDRFAPPHDRGSSHGESRIIRSAYFEDPAYLPLVREAFTLWRALEAQTGESLLTMTGAAMIGAADSDVVRGAMHTAQEHELPFELLSAGAAAERFPQHRLGSGDVAAVDGEGGVLHPERCVRAMLGRAASLGATVRTGCRVRALESRGDDVRVHVDGGASLDAHRVVVCAGPWLASLLPDVPMPLRVERQVAAWFAVRDAAAFAPERFPVFIRELPGRRFVYGVPSLDGATVKLAVHHEGATVDPDAVPREVSDADLHPLCTFAAERLRGVEPRAVRAITCLYTNTPDEHFVIDPLPKSPAVIVVSACSGHGFKFAPPIGEIAAGLALDGATPHDLSRFSLQRF
jgi:sarcosine oxidase